MRSRDSGEEINESPVGTNFDVLLKSTIQRFDIANIDSADLAVINENPTFNSSASTNRIAANITDLLTNEKQKDSLNDLGGKSVPEGDLVNNHNQQKAVSKRTGSTSSPEISMDENVIDPEKLKKIFRFKALMKSKGADDEYQLRLKQNERRFEEAMLKLKNNKQGEDDRRRRRFEEDMLKLKNNKQDEDDRLSNELSSKKRKISEKYFIKCVLNDVEPEKNE